jgi:hypothetical protein
VSLLFHKNNDNIGRRKKTARKEIIMDKMTAMAAELFDWISDDQGDEVFFRNACIGLIRDVLCTMERIIARRREVLEKEEQAREIFPLLFKVDIDFAYKQRGFMCTASREFYSLPEKTQKDVHDYLTTCCQMSGFNELFEEIVTKKL